MPVGHAQASTPPSAAAYLRIADEAEENLQKHILDQFFPRTVDKENGGFKENFGEDWSPGPNQQRKSGKNSNRLGIRL